MKKLVLGLALAFMSAMVNSLGHAAEAGLAPQTSNERGVRVSVSPVNLRKESKSWDFEVTLETHTHALDEDLAKSSTLFADGKPYPPAVWEGAPPGGHHRKGLLRFKPVMPRPPSVELQIRLTGENAPRSFLWSLKGAGDGN